MPIVIFLLALYGAGVAHAGQPEADYKECLASSAARHKPDLAQIRQANQMEEIAPMVLAASCSDVRDAYVRSCKATEPEDVCIAKMKATAAKAVLDSQTN